MTMADQ